MDGSNSIKDRIYLINNSNKLFFNSEWSKKDFFQIYLKIYFIIIKQLFVINQANKVKINFNKKEKIISFVGKVKFFQRL